MTETLITRAQLLMQQNRHDEAASMLVELLATDPNNTTLLAMLSDVQLAKGHVGKAREFISQAIGLAPDDSFLFYLKARIDIEEEQYDDADDSLNTAISLDPGDVDNYALLASLKLSRKNYNEALTLSEEALDLDPENILALNTRSTALLKLGRKEESFQTIQGALNEDPENSYTHMNYGLGLLEKGDHKKALEHFREALRHDPNNTYAQHGMAEALKAKYTFYRIYLKYAFWIGNLTARYQWGVIIGFYLIVRVLRTIAKNNSDLQPLLTPLILLLAFIAFSTWVIAPIGNLFLRFNKYGVHLLDRDEKLSSNFVAVSAVVFIISLLAFLITQNSILLIPTAYGFSMMVPLSSMFATTRKKRILINYTIAMGLVGIIAIINAMNSGEIFNAYSTLYLFMFIAYQWVANYFIIKEDNI